MVEAVGGRRKNPNITPLEIIHVTKDKMEKWIGSGRTIGEMLFEHKQEFLDALDIEANKKNRVTVTQFASIEAIANTSHSPQLNSRVPQPDAESNKIRRNILMCGSLIVKTEMMKSV